MIGKRNDSHFDHIYYNIEITPSSSEESIIARYQVDLTQAILPDANDFHLAIPVFSIPTSDLPFIYFRVEEGLGQTNPNLGIYNFGLEYLGVSYQTRVSLLDTIYQDLPVPPAPSANGGVQSDSRYYYLYEMDDFINMWNVALQGSTTDLLTAVPALAPLESPFFLFNKGLNRLSLIFDYKMVTSGINLLYNIPILKFIQGIRAENIGFNLYPGVQFRIIPTALPFFENSWKPPYTAAYTNPPAFIEMLANFEEAGSWGEVKKIIVTSISIPVRSEIKANISTLENINQPLITDYTISGWTGTRDNFVFFNQGVYRFADLLSSNPVDKIGIQVFWEDTYGFIRPIYIFFPDTFSMKLAFIREGLVS
jgi:hypothetical protein